MKKVLFVVIGILCLCSCEQWVTREWGGSTTIKLEPGEKLIEATWKGDANLWYLTEPMDSDYVPKTKVFRESSMFGVCQGVVLFVETKN